MPPSSLAELAHRGALGNMLSSSFCGCEVGTGVLVDMSSCVWRVARAPPESTAAFAALWKRAPSRKGDTASLMGRVVLLSPAWKEREGNKNGASGEEGEIKWFSHLMITDSGNGKPPVLKR